MKKWVLKYQDISKICEQNIGEVSDLTHTHSPLSTLSPAQCVAYFISSHVLYVKPLLATTKRGNVKQWIAVKLHSFLSFAFPLLFVPAPLFIHISSIRSCLCLYISAKLTLNKTLKTLTPPQAGKQLFCMNAFTEIITSPWKRELSDTRLWGYSHKRHNCAWLHFRKSQFRYRIQYGFCQSSVWGPKSTTHRSRQRKLKTKIKLYTQKCKYKVEQNQEGGINRKEASRNTSLVQKPRNAQAEQQTAENKHRDVCILRGACGQSGNRYAEEQVIIRVSSCWGSPLTLLPCTLASLADPWVPLLLLCVLTGPAVCSFLPLAAAR